jgi:dTDP-glucose 4,6-dehydratase
MKLVVTGGAGFIGSAFVRMAVAEGIQVVNLDKLTYAGNLENLTPIEGSPNYKFAHGDICDAAFLHRLLSDEKPDGLIHFAAESHVDRSILSPGAFVTTNVNGTFALLEAARAAKLARFVHVSTDEVYGSLEEPLEADENFPLVANSPYSASKASSDLLVRSYFKTYNMPVMITRASNNYGPYQFPEKLIPLMIMNALEDRKLPVYGDGQQVRDWLYAEDHCRGILSVFRRGREGEVYNIGGNRSLANLSVVHKILELTGKTEALIEYVKDRPGHDRRYALTNEKLTHETGWEPQMQFETGLATTVDWYRNNPAWIDRVRSGAYRDYYAQNYAHR